jgi:hypothetical protein
MKKTQAFNWIAEQTDKLKNSCRWNPDYIDGFKEGCETLVDWLVQQGVIKQ